MGAYLSKPIFDPETICGSGRGMAFGASSVQGWRISQEDAHNCILDFDTDCSFFAVYDGHGGSEVSKYCSLHLPAFIKGLSSYKAGDCKEALIDGFVKFDETLTKPEVIEALKQLAQDMSDSDGTVDTDEDERDVLAREAMMPLDELLRNYKNSQVSKEKDGVKKETVGISKEKNGTAVKTDEKADENSTKTEVETKQEKKPLKDGHCGDNEEKPGAGKEVTLKCEQNNGAILHGESSTPPPGDTEGGGGGTGGGSSSSGAGSSSSTVGGPSAGLSGGGSNSSGREAQRRATLKIKDKLSEVARGGDEDDDDDDSDDSDDDHKEDASGDDLDDSDEDDDDDDSGEDLSEADEDEDEDEENDDDDDGRVRPARASGVRPARASGVPPSRRVDDDDDDEVEMLDSDVPGSGSGSTAVVALLKGDVLTVANAGDSRAVLCRAGKAVDLSVDHKPEDALERTRIERAGGRVTADGRVNGGLNLSRAIGDHVYKQNAELTLPEQMISPLPDVQTVLLDRTTDDFLVLACDGIWNCMTSQEVCEFVAACIHAGDNIGQICEQLFRKCIAPDTSGDGTGCDNMTCIIVRLNSDKLQDEAPDGDQRDRQAVVARDDAAAASENKPHCNGNGSEDKDHAGSSGGTKRTADDETSSKRPHVAA